MIQRRNRGRHLAAVAEHQCKQQGPGEMELFVQLPDGVNHAQLEHLNVRGFPILQNLAHAVLHVPNGVLVDGGAQIHGAHVQAVGLHPAGIAGLTALLNGQVGDAAGGNLDHNVAVLADVINGLLQQADIRSQSAVQVTAVQVHHAGTVFVALIHIPGDGSGIDEDIRSSHRRHGNQDFFHRKNSLISKEYSGDDTYFQ